MASDKSYSFGVEIELLLRPKETDYVKGQKIKVDWKISSGAMDNRYMLRKLLMSILEDQYISATTEKSGFENWMITADASLNGDESDGYLGVEIISPILAADQDWQSIIADVYRVLSKNFDIHGTEMCSTHVHITPRYTGRKEWEVGELRSILKATCLFEKSIMDMMPKARKVCGYANSNFNSGAPQELRNLYTLIVNARKNKNEDGGLYNPLFDLIDKIETTGGFAKLYSHKFYSLSFDKFKEAKTPQGTIEFRRPPASMDAQTCAHWAVWIMAFMAKAVSTNWSLDGGIPRRDSVDALKDFICQGVLLLPEASRSGLREELLCEQF